MKEKSEHNQSAAQRATAACELPRISSLPAPVKEGHGAFSQFSSMYFCIKRFL